MEEKSKIVDQVELDNETICKLCQKQEKTDAQVEYLKESPMEHFDELNKEELINFILVCCPEEKKSKIPKKGKLEAENSGEH
eukprot:2141027-Ditylum_brightwellii.AAC.3